MTAILLLWEGDNKNNSSHHHFEQSEVKGKRGHCKIEGKEQWSYEMGGATEKGVYNWVTALPIAAHCFVLHKSAFRYALCHHCNWTPADLPKACVCGTTFTTEDDITCPTEGSHHYQTQWSVWPHSYPSRWGMARNESNLAYNHFQVGHCLQTVSQLSTMQG